MCDAAFGERPQSRLAFDASSKSESLGDNARRQPLDAVALARSRERARGPEFPVTHLPRSRHAPRSQPHFLAPKR
jgi:hypothetical protein